MTKILIVRNSYKFITFYNSIVFSSYLLEENNEELKTISYIITIFALMFALGILSSLLHAKENIHEVFLAN